MLETHRVTRWVATPGIPDDWLPMGAVMPSEFVSEARLMDGARLACVEMSPVGVAETGSVVTIGPSSVRRLSMLADVHVVLVPESGIVGTLDDASRWIETQQPPPPHFSFITGPSRTSDIERTLTIGVHGPSVLHVVVVVTE